MQADVMMILAIRRRRLGRQREERHRLRRKQARLRRRLQTPYREPIPTIPYFDPREDDDSQELQDDADADAVKEVSDDEESEEDQSEEEESGKEESEGESVNESAESERERDRIAELRKDMLSKCTDLKADVDKWVQGLPQRNIREPERSQ